MTWILPLVFVAGLVCGLAVQAAGWWHARRRPPIVADELAPLRRIGHADG